MKEKTCLALFSGGLDSMLAILLMEKLGFDVIPVNFNIGVFFKKYLRDEGRLEWKKPVPFKRKPEVVDISADFLKMIKNPPHGFGKNMNPCIDCKIIMLRTAKKLMEKYGAGFVITGEVLGQRPMTQNERMIHVIRNESGLEGYLLRPLCAKNMPLTEPEKLGWVDRSKLLDIHGRSRETQLRMAKEYGIESVMESPGGGCLLTDENYGRRLADLIKYSKDSDITERDMFLLSAGRHFRSGKAKFIIGRHEADNEKLAQAAGEGAVIFEMKDMPGPTCLAFGEIDDEAEKLIASAVARYSRARGGESAEVKIIRGNAEKVVSVTPAKEETLKQLLL